MLLPVQLNFFMVRKHAHLNKKASNNIYNQDINLLISQLKVVENCTKFNAHQCTLVCCSFSNTVLNGELGAILTSYSTKVVFFLRKRHFSLSCQKLEEMIITTFTSAC